MHSFLILAAAALILLAPVGSAQAGRYTVVDIDGSADTSLLGINTKGQATGIWEGSVFLREKDGTIVPIPVPGTDPRPLGINAHGDVAGTTYQSCGDLNCAFGFLRRADGTVTTFNASGDPLGNTYVYGVNDAGEIAGFFLDSSGTQHGFTRRSNGKVKVVDIPGATIVQLTALNDNGYVAGSFFDSAEHGLILAPDGSRTVFEIAGASTIYVRGINDDGWVVGFYLDAENKSVGFVRSPDGTVTLVDVDGTTAMSVSAINGSEEIAGTYGAKHVFGFAQTPSGMSKSLEIKGALHVAPAAINDHGVVAGTYWNEIHGVFRFYGFIWHP